jgi:hypothetical protein
MGREIILPFGCLIVNMSGFGVKGFLAFSRFCLLEDDSGARLLRLVFSVLIFV